MAHNELSIRFTENKYATRAEVSKDLKMSLIDNIWSNILSYRSNYNKYLKVRSVDKNQLHICYCPTVSNSINNIDTNLLRLLNDYVRLNDSTGDKKYFNDSCNVKALEAVAKRHELDVTNPFLRSLIHGEYREVANTHTILSRYASCLSFISKNFKKDIDIDFLAELYSTITGNFELTSFYRTFEDKTVDSRVIVDRVYRVAPSSLIETMMSDLFSFIENSETNPFVKSIVVFYYVNYVKPFPQFSAEISVLLAKSVLAHDGLDELGALFPLENLISDYNDQIDRIFLEVQKTNDITYLINFCLKYAERKIEELRDIMVNHQADELSKELYQPEEEIQPAIKIVEEKPKVEEKPVEPVQPVTKQIEKPVYETEEQVKRVETQTRVVGNEQIAYAYIPPVLDEKQAQRLEQHLLELEPSMKKGEAKFYARHCTLGKKYTIQQYKKALGCAYETARTSMDHLVELGYYRKEMVKNKNVYTPIPRK